MFCCGVYWHSIIIKPFIMKIKMQDVLCLALFFVGVRCHSYSSCSSYLICLIYSPSKESISKDKTQLIKDCLSIRISLLGLLYLNCEEVFNVLKKKDINPLIVISEKEKSIPSLIIQLWGLQYYLKHIIAPKFGLVDYRLDL